MALTPSSDISREREARRHLDRLWQRGCRFLGCTYAIMGGAMTWVSERHLVSAISNGGGFGVIASGSMTPDLLSTEIAETKKLTSRPFGVNLITLHPQLEQLIDVCLDHRVGHIVLAGGLPPGVAMQRVKRGGPSQHEHMPLGALPSGPASPMLGMGHKGTSPLPPRAPGDVGGPLAHPAECLPGVMPNEGTGRHDHAGLDDRARAHAA